MTLVPALAYIFAAFGLAYILGHAKITSWMRDWLAGAERSVPLRALVAMLECPGCLGFWIGFVYGTLAQSLSVGAALGLITCGTNTFLALLCGLIKRE